jgi:hypothetical protein
MGLRREASENREGLCLLDMIGDSGVGWGRLPLEWGRATVYMYLVF